MKEDAEASKKAATKALYHGHAVVKVKKEEIEEASLDLKAEELLKTQIMIKDNEKMEQIDDLKAKITSLEGEIESFNAQATVIDSLNCEIAKLKGEVESANAINVQVYSDNEKLFGEIEDLKKGKGEG